VSRWRPPRWAVGVPSSAHYENSGADGTIDSMTDVLPDFPDDVAAYACHGHLTRAGYAAVAAAAPQVADA